MDWPPNDFEKTWHGRSGTLTCRMSWKKKKEEQSEEQLEDWEVVDTPPYEEMKTFKGREAPVQIGQLVRDAVDDTKPSPSTIAEREKAGLLQALTSSESTKAEADEGELYPCERCNSYHYIETCIYHLPEQQWREYQQIYMSSQPYLPPDLGGTNFKRHRMTNSGRRMLADDADWRKERTLESRRAAVPKDASGERFRQVWEEAEKETQTERDAESDDDLFDLIFKGKGKARARE